MTKDRIERAQAEIATVLPARPELVVSTSRFEVVKAYVERIQRANWVYAGAEREGPRMRRRTDAESGEKKGKEEKGKEDKGKTREKGRERERK